MTRQGADQAVVVSAVVVVGVYTYRRLIEPGVPMKSKGNPPASLGRFLVGYGVAFFIISLVASGSPELGGWLAILLAAGTVLTNGVALASDVNTRLAG